jgi:uncharacterized protein (TIGR04551 family)
MRARLLLLLLIALIAWSPVGGVHAQPREAPSGPKSPAGAERSPLKQPRKPAPPPAQAQPPTAPAAPETPPAEPKAPAAAEGSKPPATTAPATPATPAEPPAQGGGTEEGTEASGQAAGGVQAGVEVEASAQGEPAAVEAAASTERAESGPPPEPAELEPSLPPAVPSPAELEERLAEDFPEGLETDDAWTAPVPVLTLHGYMRVRAEMMDSFFLGREQVDSFTMNPANRDFMRGQGPDPFSRFRPVERRVDPATGLAPNDLVCVDESTSGDATCDVDALQFMNMRLRLSPQINLSEDVRVKTTFDIFDNMVAGEAPASYYGGGDPGSTVGQANTTVFAGTDTPPSGGGLSDSIVARRAWAEVRNRDLGELRFGRMPQHWGLGMYYNAGNLLDQDFSTDLDRVLAITKIVGLYLSFSYDFIAEGFIEPGVEDRPAVDASQLDDVDQFTFSVARKHSPEEEAADIERGDVVLNGGLQFQIRNQDSIYNTGATGDTPLVPVEATHYTLDLWGKFRWRGIRTELEAVWVTGSMDNFVSEMGPSTYDINQFGYALENEFRLLDDKLGLHFDHGFASGDQDVEGLSADADYITQLGDFGNTVTTFRFHPSYQIDLILWRQIMRQVTGAYYFRPGISYDFVRGAFGELFGARLDFIWSRASSFTQTWGNDEDLGIELNASLYFRSEDGPDPEDGYHARIHYGVLFPMRGLGYYHEDTNLDAAQTLRLILGVVF